MCNSCAIRGHQHGDDDLSRITLVVRSSSKILIYSILIYAIIPTFRPKSPTFPKQSLWFRYMLMDRHQESPKLPQRSPALLSILKCTSINTIEVLSILSCTCINTIEVSCTSINTIEVQDSSNLSIIYRSAWQIWVLYIEVHFQICHEIRGNSNGDDILSPVSLIETSSSKEPCIVAQ